MIIGIVIIFAKFFTWFLFLFLFIYLFIIFMIQRSASIDLSAGGDQTDLVARWFPVSALSFIL